jgi:hypothetical protein
MSADRADALLVLGARSGRARDVDEETRHSPHRQQRPSPRPTASAPLGQAHANLHASCVIIGECGILIRGASGAGKSSLAAALVSRARERGEFAAWVADDRVLLKVCGGRLIASPHPVVAGHFEARGLGIMSHAYEAQAVLRLVIDLETSVERWPCDGDLTTIIANVAVQRLPLVAGRVGLYETSLVFRHARTSRE